MYSHIPQVRARRDSPAVPGTASPRLAVSWVRIAARCHSRGWLAGRRRGGARRQARAARAKRRSPRRADAARRNSKLRPPRHAPRRPSLAPHPGGRHRRRGPDGQRHRAGLRDEGPRRRDQRPQRRCAAQRVAPRARACALACSHDRSRSCAFAGSGACADAYYAARRPAFPMMLLLCLLIMTPRPACVASAC